MLMSAARIEESGESPKVEAAIIRLLAHRYGDGLVYLRGQEERELYERAKQLGLISREGYLTPAGRSVLTGHDD